MLKKAEIRAVKLEAEKTLLEIKEAKQEVVESKDRGEYRFTEQYATDVKKSTKAREKKQNTKLNKKK